MTEERLKDIAYECVTKVEGQRAQGLIEELIAEIERLRAGLLALKTHYFEEDGTISQGPLNARIDAILEDKRGS